MAEAPELLEAAALKQNGVDPEDLDPLSLNRALGKRKYHPVYAESS